MRCLFAICLAALAGCSNGFLKFYRGSQYPPVEQAHRVGFQPVDTRFIGESVFTSPNNNTEGDLLDAACTVGADYVTWEWVDDGTSQSNFAMPVTTPTTSTTHYSGSTYGNGFSARHYGTATTYGSQTNYVPFTIVERWIRHHARFYRSTALDAVKHADDDVDPFTLRDPLR